MSIATAVATEGAPVAVLINNRSPNWIPNAAYPGTHGPLVSTIRSGTSFSLSLLQSLPLLVLSLQPCTVESASTRPIRVSIAAMVSLSMQRPITRPPHPYSETFPSLLVLSWAVHHLKSSGSPFFALLALSAAPSASSSGSSCATSSSHTSIVSSSTATTISCHNRDSFISPFLYPCSAAELTSHGSYNFRHVLFFLLWNVHCCS